MHTSFEHYYMDQLYNHHLLKKGTNNHQTQRKSEKVKLDKKVQIQSEI